MSLKIGIQAGFYMLLFETLKAYWVLSSDWIKVGGISKKCILNVANAFANSTKVMPV